MAERPRRVCPACTLLRGSLVNPGCRSCRGSGYLVFGEWALAQEDRAKVASAIARFYDDALAAATESLVGALMVERVAVPIEAPVAPVADIDDLTARRLAGRTSRRRGG